VWVDTPTVGLIRLRRLDTLVLVYFDLPFFVRVAVVAFDSLGSPRRRWVELVVVSHVGCIRHVRVVECWAGTAVGFDSCRFAGRVVSSLCGMCRRWAGAKAGLLTLGRGYRRWVRLSINKPVRFGDFFN